MARIRNRGPAIPQNRFQEEMDTRQEVQVFEENKYNSVTSKVYHLRGGLHGLGASVFVCDPPAKELESLPSLPSKTEKLDELELVNGEHRSPDWDGYDADAASEKSLSFARDFIEFIPVILLNFEIDVEPNGWFAFEWYKPDSTFSIAFDVSGDAHYAALLDGQGSYGTFSVAEGIPRHLMWMMSQTFRQSFLDTGVQFSVFGAGGSGKSTLLKIISGLAAEKASMPIAGFWIPSRTCD